VALTAERRRSKCRRIFGTSAWYAACSSIKSLSAAGTVGVGVRSGGVPARRHTYQFQRRFLGRPCRGPGTVQSASIDSRRSVTYSWVGGSLPRNLGYREYGIRRALGSSVRIRLSACAVKNEPTPSQRSIPILRLNKSSAS